MSLILLLLSNISFGQSDPNKDTYDSIRINKSKYIGQPLSVLFSDIKVLISFSDPDNMGSLKKGSAYYKHFSIYLSTATTPLYDISIEINSEVTISREDVIESRRNKTLERKLKVLLKNKIVTDLKFY